jgi:hypothetical protein
MEMLDIPAYWGRPEVALDRQLVKIQRCAGGGKGRIPRTAFSPPRLTSCSRCAQACRSMARRARNGPTEMICPCVFGPECQAPFLAASLYKDLYSMTDRGRGSEWFLWLKHV